MKNFEITEEANGVAILDSKKKFLCSVESYIMQ